MSFAAEQGRPEAKGVRPRPLLSIAVGGLIVGVIDMVYAIAVYSPRAPLRIPQAIATGLLGRRSFTLGFSSIALGTVCHFVIALGAAAVYTLASRRLTILIRRPVLCGLVYGALVYFFMHWVVIPLSAVPPGHSPLIYKVCEFVEHWFGVGLPIALAARRWAS